MSAFKFPVPTVDRPFGYYLFEHFDEAVTILTQGKFIPSEFEFVAGETVLSTPTAVFTIIGLYYVVIFGGHALINKLGLRPLVLNGLFTLHNAFLTTLSFILLTLFFEQLVPMIWNHGIYYAICDHGAWTPELVTLYYLNYITKFIEFIDTVFLVVKQKKLTFLHTYHHGATALLCYTQLIGLTSISWVPIFLNLGVHVLMYFYYFLAARGIRVWWKEWVTRFQILQFILDLGFIYFATYQKVVYNFAPGLPHCGDCAGTTLATVSGCAIISSYLFLFIAFYIEVYTKKTKKSKVVKRVRGGVAAKVNEYVSLDKQTLQSSYDSNTGSPIPTQRKRVTRSSARLADARGATFEKN